MVATGQTWGQWLVVKQWVECHLVGLNHRAIGPLEGEKAVGTMPSQKLYGENA
jgi:hypothetical protein